MFSKLPSSLLTVTNQYLPHQAQASLAATCSLFMKTTQKSLYEGKLIAFIDRGFQDKAHILLLQFPQLAAKRIIFTDSAKRTFNCSPFEYALWSLDTRFMCQMMMDCLPLTSKGEETRIELLKQFHKVTTEGLTYRYKDAYFTQTHFSLEPLKSASNTFIENADIWDMEEASKYMISSVGGEQALLPKHLLQHWCSVFLRQNPRPDMNFFESLKLNSDNFLRVCSIVNGPNLSLFRDEVLVWGALGGLGVTTALTRGDMIVAHIKTHGFNRRDILCDLAAITALDKERREVGIPALFKRLEVSLLSPDAKPFTGEAPAAFDLSNFHTRFKWAVTHPREVYPEAAPFVTLP